MLELKKATKEKCKLRLVLVGVPGAGKTYSALNIASNLAPGGKVLVLDSEYGSASKYADIFDFYTLEVTDHDPRNYIKLIKEAGQAGVDVLVIDSLSHAWQALLDLVSKEGAKSRNPYGGWDKGTPIQRELIEAILASKCHVIATARQKSEYVVAPNQQGKMAPTKVGMKSEQKADIEFEFDVAGELDTDNSLRITKTRCPGINGKSFHKPGKELADILRAWLDAGAAPAPKPASGTTQAPTQQTKNSDSASKDASSPSSDKSPSDHGKTSQTSTSQGSGSASADPKSGTPGSTGSSAAGSGTQGSAGARPAQDKMPTAVERANSRAEELSKPVGKEQMGQLLQTGQANGWEKEALRDYVSKTFGVSKEKPLNWKDWETAVKVVGRPENKGGNLVVDGAGKRVAA